MTDLGGAMIEGSLTSLTPANDDGLPGIVIGKDLATEIGAKLGDIVQRADAKRDAVADGRDAAAASIQGRRAVPHGAVPGRFAGSGFVDLDRGMLLAGTDRVEHIELKVANIYDAPRIADEIAEQFGQDYVTQDWTDINQQLYSALMLEKIGMGIGIGLIVAVAALNIVASLILLVMEKTRDIAILKTMGASSKSITLIFLLQGTIIGVDRHDRRRGGRRHRLLLSRSLSSDHDSKRHLSSELSALQAPAGRSGCGGGRRGGGLLRGHALSVTPGGAPRSGSGAQVRVARWRLSRSAASTSSTRRQARACTSCAIST